MTRVQIALNHNAIILRNNPGYNPSNLCSCSNIQCSFLSGRLPSKGDRTLERGACLNSYLIDNDQQIRIDYDHQIEVQINLFYRTAPHELPTFSIVCLIPNYPKGINPESFTLF